MSERVNRLRSHQRNIDRYQGLLKSGLSDVELRFVEQRLSEERFALAMLQFMNGSTKMKGVLRVVVRCQESVIPGFSAAQSATTIDRCESDMLYTTSPEGEFEKVMRQWSAPGMGNGQGNLDYRANDRRLFGASPAGTGAFSRGLG